MINRQKPVFKIAHIKKEKRGSLTHEVIIVYFEEKNGGSGTLSIVGDYGTYKSKITGKSRKISEWHVNTPGLTKYGGANGLKFKKKTSAIKSVKAYYNK